MDDRKAETTSYTRVREGSVYTLLGRVLTAIVTFAVGVFVVRRLAVYEFGVYNLLIAVMGYIGLFSSLGLPSVFERFVAEFHEKGQIGFVRQLVWKGSLLRVGISAGLVVATVVFSRQLATLLQSEDWVSYFHVFAFAVVFALEAELLGTALNALFLQKYQVIATTIYTYLRSALVFLLLRSGLHLTGMLLAEIAAYVVLAGLSAFFYLKKTPAAPRSHQDRLPARRLVRFGVFSYFNEMGATALEVSTDFFVISAFLGPAAVAVYAFASRLVDQVAHWMPNSLFHQVISPLFFRRYARTGETRDLSRMFNFTTKLTTFFFFPIAVGMFVLGDKFICFVYDPKYLESLPVLWAVTVFFAVNTCFSSIGLVVQAVERVEIQLASKVFAVYNLVGDLLVVGRYGVLGVALVTGSAVVFKNLMMFVMIQRHVRLRIDLKGIALIIVNSMLMGGAIYLSRPLVANVMWFALVVLLGMIMYGASSYFIRAFNPQELQTIRNLLRVARNRGS